MPVPSQVLDASLSLVRDRKVGGNRHPSMLQFHYISGSNLVKRTAKRLIEVILTDAPEDPDEDHWGESGNALAEVNLAHVRCQEPLLTAPIPGTNGWILSIHPDGLDLRDESGAPWMWSGYGDAGQVYYATVFENKAPMFEPGHDKVEVYYRQGLLQLACLLAQHARGNRTLQPAAWLAAADPRKRPWALPAIVMPGQVAICIQPSVSPKSEQAFPVDTDTCRKHLDRYLTKAAIIIKGVLAQDPQVGAREWDEVKGKGLGEFDLKGQVPEVTDAEVFKAVEEERSLADAKKKAEEAHDRAKAGLEAFLRGKGLEQVQVGAYRVALQRTRGGIRHFTVEDSVSLRVYGKKNAFQADKVVGGEGLIITQGPVPPAAPAPSAVAL